LVSVGATIATLNGGVNVGPGDDEPPPPQPVGGQYVCCDATTVIVTETWGLPEEYDVKHAPAPRIDAGGIVSVPLAEIVAGLALMGAGVLCPSSVIYGVIVHVPEDASLTEMTTLYVPVVVARAPTQSPTVVRIREPLV
jgi:hypothetical protein